MEPDEWVVDFPTLGFLAADWIEHHCVIPGGYHVGRPLILNGWQLWCTVKHYQVRTNAVFDPERPRGAAMFQHRRSIVVGPQKAGKSPWGAAMMLLEAVGPSMFAGWAAGGEVYRCADNGCTCGFEYTYDAGEPMGMVRPKSLIQLTAVNEDQVANVYEPMQTMVRLGRGLSDLIKVREGFLRLPNEGRVEAATSGDKSKIGRPITAALADETGQYTRRNRLFGMWVHMRRGLSGMGGRSLELTNAPDPSEGSSAQVGMTNALMPDIDDVFVYYREPPANLSYKNKRERAKIHRYVYLDSPWVDLEDIEREAAELLKTDPETAERYYGNRKVQGKGAYMDAGTWESTLLVPTPPARQIALGFDGSRSDDWTALRAETLDGHRFTPVYGPDDRPTYWAPEEWGGRIPRGEVDAAVREMFSRYKVARAYIDPRHWETQADEWALDFGDDTVVLWPTNSHGRMFDALVRFLDDSIDGLTTHDDDKVAELHMLAARKRAISGDRYLLEKPSENQKIDIAMADILAHEAAADMRALGWSAKDDKNQVIIMR